MLLIFGVALSCVVASFTCVIVDRLPLALDEPNEYGELWDTRPWNEVVGGTSRCSSCGAGVRWYHNVPVLGWLALRGKCRDCGERIPAFHPLLEVGIPAVGALVTWAVVADQGWTWALLPYLFLVPVGAAISAIDLRTLIVPTRIVWPAAVITAVLCIGAAAAEGQLKWILGALVGVVALAGPLFVIWFIFPAGMGFGDVRLCVMLGMVVGLAASTTGRSWPWSAVLCVMCLGISAIVGLVIAIPGLLVGLKKVPFGPALVVGALLCAALAGPILRPFG